MNGSGGGCFFRHLSRREFSGQSVPVEGRERAGRVQRIFKVRISLHGDFSGIPLRKSAAGVTETVIQFRFIKKNFSFFSFSPSCLFWILLYNYVVGLVQQESAEEAGRYLYRHSGEDSAGGESSACRGPEAAETADFGSEKCFPGKRGGKDVSASAYRFDAGVVSKLLKLNMK